MEVLGDFPGAFWGGILGLLLFLLLVPMSLGRAAPVPGAKVPTAQSSDAVARSRAHYASGVALFETGNKAQALVEFQLAAELAPKNHEVVFAIAQCAYHLGKLDLARARYSAYLAAMPSGPIADTARLRLVAIDKRPALLSIQTVPDGVKVTITGENGVVHGEAPGKFELSKGTYRVQLSKKNHEAQERKLTLKVADSQTLFVRLNPRMARMQITTSPSDAQVYVRGPGRETHTTKSYHPVVMWFWLKRNITSPLRRFVRLGPAETRQVRLDLRHIQRSGRSELIGFWAGVGAALGATAVPAALEADEPTPASAALVATAGLTGALMGGVVSTSMVPTYIPDHKALFRMGVTWMGAAEGALFAMSMQDEFATGWAGGALGTGLGALAGVLLDEQAPSFGRGALLHSAGLMGLTIGALTVPALRAPGRYLPVAMFGGLNVGVLTGVAGAYLSAPGRLGPSWQRVLLVDFATAAGFAFGALSSTLATCVNKGIDNRLEQCEFVDDARTAQTALIGGAVGLLSGILLTRNVDAGREARGADESGWAGLAPRLMNKLMPRPTLMSVSGGRTGSMMLPGVAAQGSF